MRTGFTLIELLVAVSILGILAAVGSVTYSKVMVTSRDAQRQTEVAFLAKAIEIGKDWDRKVYKFDLITASKAFTGGIHYSGPRGEDWEPYCVKTVNLPGEPAPADMIDNTFNSSCANEYDTLRTSISTATGNHLGAGNITAWTICARTEKGQPVCSSSLTAKATPMPTPTTLPTSIPTPTPTIPPCLALQQLITSASQVACGAPGYDRVADTNQNDNVDNNDLTYANALTRDFTSNSLCKGLLLSSVDPCVNSTFKVVKNACRMDFDGNGVVEVEIGQPDANLFQSCFLKTSSATDSSGNSCAIYDVNGSGGVSGADTSGILQFSGQQCN